MDELTLEAYAVIQHWHLPGADDQWESILGEYLQTIAHKCISADKCVIGHIKALSTFPDQKYLRISVVAAHIPATTEGKAPAGCTNLELTLNVLVYGLERTVIEQITSETANDMAYQNEGEVYPVYVNQAGDLPHHLEFLNQSKK